MNGGQHVSWRDYEGIDGFGMLSQEHVQDLNKALRAGQDINAPAVGAGVGFPLRVESLEATLKVLSYRMEHVRFWKGVPKLPAFNTVEEYNLLKEYGAGQAAFIDEGDLPEEDDSTYERATTLIKYLGTTRRVTHVMSLVRPAHGNVVAQETMNGTLWLLRQLEKALFFGDAAIVPQHFDGLDKLLVAGAPAANTIDLRGKPLTPDTVEDAVGIVVADPNFGMPTDLYCAYGPYSDLAKQFYPKERYDLPAPKDGIVGIKVTHFQSQAGPIAFQPDVFVPNGPRETAPVAGSGPAAKRPNAPTVVAAPPAHSNAASKFVADDAGTYFYQVTAVNKSGESAPTRFPAAGTVTVAAGDRVSMTVGDGGQGTTGYKIYRTKKGGSTAYYLRSIARSGATQVLTDDNQDLPATSKAWLCQMNLEGLSFKQLAPFSRIPLSTIDTSLRWMQILYGSPTVYAPGKFVRVINVGRLAGTNES